MRAPGAFSGLGGSGQAGGGGCRSGFGAGPPSDGSIPPASESAMREHRVFVPNGYVSNGRLLSGERAAWGPREGLRGPGPAMDDCRNWNKRSSSPRPLRPRGQQVLPLGNRFSAPQGFVVIVSSGWKRILDGAGEPRGMPADPHQTASGPREVGLKVPRAPRRRNRHSPFVWCYGVADADAPVPAVPGS